jgi:hypothetical protein
MRHPMKRKGECSYRSTNIGLGNGVVSGQLHASAPLPSKKEAPVLIA